MNQEELKFQIDQIRKDKIIWAVEMSGVNLAVIIGIFLTIEFIDIHNLKNGLLILGSLFVITYSLYASIGNVLRHRKILKLEKVYEAKTS